MIAGRAFVMALAAVALFVGAVAESGWAIADRASGLKPLQPLAKRCAAPDVTATPFRFKASDGTVLDGAVLGEGDVGVVLAHQAFSDLCLWLPFGLELSGQGFRVLLFDFRNHGLAQRVLGSRDGRVDLDVMAAAAELRRRGARKIVLVGASLGGAAVVRGAVSTRPVVSAVVSISPPDTKLLTGFPTYLPLDPTAAAARLRVPLLVIAGRSDPSVPVASSIRIFRASPSTKKRLVVVASSAHGAGLLGGSGPSAEKARNALFEYIRLHAGS